MAHSRHHSRTISRTDEEWEAMREPFRKCYIDQDMSLKEATRHLAVNHGFPASERQWERKKEHWNFTKYQKRETRQQFIEQALNRGMNMEDILNASDIPVEGPVGDDRAARRNWRRYVKRSERSRSRQSHSQPHSPVEASRRSFDLPGANRQDHHVVEKTYDINMPEGIVLDQMTGALPDSVMLEATSTAGMGESPLQVHVVSEINPPLDTNPAPEIFFSTWDDAAGSLQDHGPLAQTNFPNFTNISFPSDTDMLPSSGADPSSAGDIAETYGTFSAYQPPLDSTDFGQQTAYGNTAAGQWSGQSESTVAFNTVQQDFYGNSGNITDDSESFPSVEQVPQLHFDPSFDVQTPVPVTPRTKAQNDYFSSMTADPLTTDISDMVDMYTTDIQKMIQTFLTELPRTDPKVLQKIEEGLQARRDLCLRTVTTEIEVQARNKQRATESITEKCRNLEQIMSEKGIDTRAELRYLKARSHPRQPVENSAQDMSQFYELTSAFAI